MKVPRSSARIVLWGMAVLAAGVLARSGARWPELVITRIDHCPELGCDFVHHYMPQVRVLFAQPGEVVFGWVYPPLLAIALQWLRPFSDATAVRIWTALGLAAAAVLLLLCRRALRAHGRWTSWAGAFGLVALSLPVVHCIKWGQPSVAIGVAAVYALCHARRSAPVLLGLVAALKPYALAYLLVPLARREWRMPAKALAWALGSGVLLPLAVLGPAATLRFFDAAFGARAGALALHPDILAYLGGQALLPALLRWFASSRRVGLEGTAALVCPLRMRLAALGEAGSILFIVILALPIACVALFTFWKLRERRVPPPVAGTLGLVALTLLVGPGWHHYFAFLPFGLAVILSRCSRSGHRIELVLAALAWLVSALPLLLLADVPAIYFHWSTWGGTTVSALLTWFALLRSALDHPQSE